MRLRSSALLVLCAACSPQPGAPTAAEPNETERPVQVVAVPLTAASVSIAASQRTHADVVPPWTLTASDGSGLLLSRVDAKAVFEGPLAFTELHLYFHNGEDRIREGTFQITLPVNAAVSRFAMENNGQWMEAEVVEKQLARRAYDDFLHRRQDPALLEKAAGNQFTAKVFPIAGKSDKHLVISYSQELPGAQYQLPLRGLPKTERVDVALSITGTDGKRTEQKLSERNWQPDRDFVSTVTTTAVAVMAGTVVATQIEIGDAQTTREPLKSITLMVDTSASRGLGFASYIASVGKLVNDLETTWGAALTLQVVAFDQDAEQIFVGRATDFGDAQIKQLLERGAAGASDLGQALAWTAQRAPQSRVVVVTDGVITAGSEGAELHKQVAALATAKVQRIDFVLAGGLRDSKAMAALVRTGLPRAGTVLDLETDPVATALGESVALDVAIEIPGASWIYPRTIETARAGTRAMVYARLDKPMQTLDVKVAGKQHRIALLAATAPLVERAVASAEIEELEATLAKTTKAADKTALRETIAKKSVASRVISSQTSFLVLESDGDFARYGIDRKALADVLVVGANGIERKGRAAPVQIAEPRVVTKTKTTTSRTQNTAPSSQPPEAKPTDKNSDSKLDSNEIADRGDFEMAKKRMKEEKGDESDKDSGSSLGHMAGPSTGSFDGRPGQGASAGSASGAGVADQIVARPPPSPPRSPEPAPRTESSRPSPSRRPPRDIESGALMQEEDGDGGSREAWPPKNSPAALKGELATIAKLLAKKNVDGALAKARDWHAREPGNVLALIGLGDALEAKGSPQTAARVYGSIIDLFPGRADMRRFAGERLSRVQHNTHDLIVDTYRRAVADRPDHMTSHRLFAYALVRAGKPAEAFAAILAGIDQKYPDGRFAGGERVLADDAGMIGANYAAAVPAKRSEIAKALAKRGLAIATKPSTRFILYWETDANDVDFHIQDAKGGHAFYSNPTLPSGGELYADITTGYGPECFAIAGKPTAGPYRLSINYYSQGPMGYGMGLLEIQRFDGKGGLTFVDRPYVIMNDHAYVELGTFR